jgi:uncharacterized membrane protein YdcZ (DUF606 family)
MLSTINPWAVLAAAFVHMATGLIWFNSNLFGRQWSELTKQELKPAREWLLVGLIGHVLIASVLALVVRLAHATTMLDGIIVGMLMWAGFVVTLEIGELIWEKIPFRLFAIRIGNHLVALSLAGAVLSVWP